jgi:hypothetical protein
VLPRPQLIFPSETWFLGIHLNSQQQKLLKNQYLPHSEPTSYQINSIKSSSSRSLQQHQKEHSNSSEIFSYDLIEFSVKKIIQCSRTFAPQVQTTWNQARAPLLVESFPKTPRTQSEASWFGGSHNNKTKQTTFLHR